MNPITRGTHKALEVGQIFMVYSTTHTPPESQRGWSRTSSACWRGQGTSDTWFASGCRTRRSSWKLQRSLCAPSQTPPLWGASYLHTLENAHPTDRSINNWCEHTTGTLLYTHKAVYNNNNHHHNSNNSMKARRPWPAAVPLMTPMMSGWGMADLMWRDCS